MPVCPLFRYGPVLINAFNIFMLMSHFQSQYKFIYRAISDYVDLHRNKDDDEYAYSVPVNSVNNGGTLPPSGSRTPAGAISTAGSSKSGTLNSKKSK